MSIPLALVKGSPVTPERFHEARNVPFLVNFWTLLVSLAVSVTYTSSFVSIVIANGCAN
jgi:hypothetical protein